MTMPNERTRAVLRTREFLQRLASPYVEGGIKKVPAEVRKEALRLLKHYPFPYDLRTADTSFDGSEALRFFT
jgi:hypothetical protein